MLHRGLRSCALAAALSFVAGPLRAQSATVVGNVTAARTGEPLGGATIQVDGTRRGAATAASGSYRSPNVPPDTYTVTARLLGYARVGQSITGAQTATVGMNCALQRAATTLGVMLVTGTPLGQPQRALGNAVGKVTVTEITKVAPPPNVQQLLNNVP